MLRFDRDLYKAAVISLKLDYARLLMYYLGQISLITITGYATFGSMAMINQAYNLFGGGYKLYAFFGDIVHVYTSYYTAFMAEDDYVPGDIKVDDKNISGYYDKDTWVTYENESTSTSTATVRAKLELHGNGYMRYERKDPRNHKSEIIMYTQGTSGDGVGASACDDSDDEGPCAWGRAGASECGFVCHCSRCMHAYKPNKRAVPAVAMKRAAEALRSVLPSDTPATPYSLDDETDVKVVTALADTARPPPATASASDPRLQVEQASQSSTLHLTCDEICTQYFTDSSNSDENNGGGIISRDNSQEQPVRKYQRLSDLPADELDGWTGDPTIDYRYADAYVVTDTVKACTNLLAKSLSNIGRRLMGRRLPAIIDTGATRHVSGIKDYFPDELISDANPRGAVKIADGRALPIRAVGCLVVYVPSVNPKTNAPGIHKLVLSEALYVPGMNETLISPRAAFTLDGTRTYFNDDNYMELKDGTIIPFAAGDKHYHLAISNDFQEEAMSAENGRRQTTRLTTPDLIHSRLSHFSHERIRASAKHTTGVDLEGLGPGNDCDSCVIGGARKAPSPAATTPEEPRYTYFGQKICSDTCAMPKSSPFGFTGMVCFLDMATHYVGLYFIKSHEGGEILSCLKQWMAEHREHLTDKGLVEWRTDNATEFFNSESDTGGK